MTKADMRIKKSLAKIRHALCRILTSTPELTDCNFTVRIIAKMAGVSQSTVRRRIRQFERKTDTGVSGCRISPWTLFELFNAEVMEEFEQRRAFQNKIGVGGSTGDFFMQYWPLFTITTPISAR
ncbi:MAG: hypothetical protein NC305_10935 [Lachnospiraceae bacterium]|nr:hypothetical protein [Lachnospiraceae bacterium]